MCLCVEEKECWVCLAGNIVWSEQRVIGVGVEQTHFPGTRNFFLIVSTEIKVLLHLVGSCGGLDVIGKVDRYRCSWFTFRC